MVMVVVPVPVVMRVIVVVMMVVVAVGMHPSAAGLLPQGDRPDHNHHKEGDAAEQDRDEELRREDVFQLRLPVIASDRVHRHRHAAQGAAGEDGAKLVEVIRATVVVVVRVSHGDNLSN
jgi:hypothetical protein